MNLVTNRDVGKFNIDITFLAQDLDLKDRLPTKRTYKNGVFELVYKLNDVGADCVSGVTTD